VLFFDFSLIEQKVTKCIFSLFQEPIERLLSGRSIFRNNPSTSYAMLSQHLVESHQATQLIQQ